jgi:hypothetical protein
MANYNFPPTSRYHGVEIATRELPNGEQIRHLRRRFIPTGARFALLYEHVVGEGERIDLIASRELGDAESYWRICDANDALRPADLEQPIGRRVRITLPEGIPGPAR